ncbi:hypothetical protein Vi05172_g4780 [Venturia inaequalis]|nr:hypothetical protein Vi05172_g4780 [Venturia inaequalis]
MAYWASSRISTFTIHLVKVVFVVWEWREKEDALTRRPENYIGKEGWYTTEENSQFIQETLKASGQARLDEVAKDKAAMAKPIDVKEPSSHAPLPSPLTPSGRMPMGASAGVPPRPRERASLPPLSSTPGRAIFTQAAKVLEGGGSSLPLGRDYEYKIVKNVGACPKHRREKKKVGW